MFTNRQKNKKEDPMAHALAEALAIAETTCECFDLETEKTDCFFVVRDDEHSMVVESLETPIPTEQQQFFDWLLGLAFIVAENGCTLTKFGINE